MKTLTKVEAGKKMRIFSRNMQRQMRAEGRVTKVALAKHHDIIDAGWIKIAAEANITVEELKSEYLKSL